MVPTPRGTGYLICIKCGNNYYVPKSDNPFLSIFNLPKCPKCGSLRYKKDIKICY